MHHCTSQKTELHPLCLLAVMVSLLLLLPACGGGRATLHHPLESSPADTVELPGNRSEQAKDRPAGVPAYPDTISYLLPDGYELLIFLRGDEWGHMALSVDGHYLLMNEDGFYEYASPGEAGTLESTGIVARNEADRSEAQRVLLQSLPKHDNH